MVVRKYYKRTLNKVEWMILDFGGNEQYQQVHSIFFSSIEHDSEPTIFVIVYSHSEYSADNHEKLIGSWINSILIHSNVPKQKSINIKLIGITNESQTEQDIDDTLAKVKEYSSRSVSNYLDKLKKTKNKIEDLLNNSNVSEENKSYLNTIMSNIDISLKAKVKICDQVTLIDSSFKKKTVEKVINDLEKITINLDRTVPLELNRILKCFLPKLKTKAINYEELIQKFKSDQILENIIKKNKKYKMTSDDIFNYARTIGEIFWTKYDSDLNKYVFLHYEFILNCLRLFIRHDLDDYLTSDKTKFFNTCGFFENNIKYEESVNFYKKYGILEDKLLRFISFCMHQMNSEQVNELVDILNQFMIIYKSETQNLEDNCPFFQVVLPFKCIIDYDLDKNSEGSTFDKDLYSDDFYKYFIRYDKIYSRREEIKETNSLRKQKELWSNNENEYLDEFENPERQSRSSSIQKSQSEVVRFNYFQELEKLKTLCQEDFKNLFKLKAIFEITSFCKIDWHFFNKFSVLIQNYCCERFDWRNVIIARDLNGTCIRFKYLDLIENDQYSIKIEIFSQEMSFLNELKSNLNLILNKLSAHYPGLFLIRSFFISNK